MNQVKFQIETPTGECLTMEAPTDMNLSLMEWMKASEIPVLATCGGMALCATCHVEILEGHEQLPEVSDAELDMIDTLPMPSDHSRLACQLRLGPHFEGLKIRFAGEEG